MSELHERAKAVFLEAVALPPAQRGAFAARECAEDEALRREVESLLAHHDPQTLLLETTAGSRGPPDAPSAGPGRAAAETGAVGRKSERISGLIFAQLFGNLRRKYAAVLAAFVGPGSMLFEERVRFLPSSPGTGGKARPSASRPSFTQFTIRVISCPFK